MPPALEVQSLNHKRERKKKQQFFEWTVLGTGDMVKKTQGLCFSGGLFDWGDLGRG